jgi:3-deoxy-7-phosphoheptulonate synthase
LHAWSDGEQSLNEKNYLTMMSEVEIMVEAMKKINEGTKEPSLI